MPTLENIPPRFPISREALMFYGAIGLLFVGAGSGRGRLDRIAIKGELWHDDPILVDFHGSRDRGARRGRSALTPVCGTTLPTTAGG